jgi:hypothetical protein
MTHPAFTMVGQLGLCGPIAVVPKQQKKAHPYVRKSLARQRILEALILEDGPATSQELAELTGLCLHITQQYCRAMADEGLLVGEGRKPIYYSLKGRI